MVKRLVRLDLDPTISKVVLIALLLFAEGIAIPTYTVINQGRWPTDLEFMGFLLSAFIQLITFLITFLKTGQLPEEKEKKEEAEIAPMH